MRAKSGPDALGFYLTGAASDGAPQPDPSASLGGYRSSNEFRSVGAIVEQPIQSLLVENVTPANGEGLAYIDVVACCVRYTPPDGQQGIAISIEEGERRFITGADFNKGVRIYRGSGGFSGRMILRLAENLNGALSMENVSNTDRVAGLTTYRALMLYAHGVSDIKEIKIWHDLAFGPRQAVYSFGKEVVGSGGEIQTIADEETAPSGISWVTATDQESGLSIQELLADETIGLWIRREFPVAGSVQELERTGMGTYFESVF